MREFLIALGNISFETSIVVLAVLVARSFFRACRAPKWASYLLWSLPFLRMAVPVNVESAFSFFGIFESFGGNKAANGTGSAGIPAGSTPAGLKANPSYGVMGNSTATGNIGSGADTLANAMTIADSGTSAGDWLVCILFVSWLTGMLLLTLYGIISYWNLKKKLACSICMRDNIYLADGIDTPFVLGITKPCIYLPSDMEGQDMTYVLCHEKVHIRRKDYLVKIAAYFVTAVYWFNPLAWVAFHFLGKDMELACDEVVLGTMEGDCRGPYATALLELSTDKRRFSGVPLAFGEGDTKGRIKSIMKYRKPALTVSVVAVIILIVMAWGFLTNPKSNDSTEKAEGQRTSAESTEEAFISQEAENLYAAANPYIGDVSANGKLMGLINEYYGGFGSGATTELQTSEEPYALTLHFTEEPNENAMRRNAVLLLALIKNCGEVDWDYETSDGLVTCYVSLADANENLGIANIKEYGTTAGKVQELLDLLKLADDPDMRVSNGTNVWGTRIKEPQDYTELITELLPGLPDDPTLSGENIIIAGMNGTIHMELWQQFYEKVTIQVPADLLIANYTVEGDVIYTYVSYDGTDFYVVEDYSRDKMRGNGPEYYEGTWKYLLTDEGKYRDGSVYETVHLVNDDSVTYKDIMDSLLSSVYPSDIEYHFLLWMEKETEETADIGKIIM